MRVPWDTCLILATSPIAIYMSKRMGNTLESSKTHRISGTNLTPQGIAAAARRPPFCVKRRTKVRALILFSPEFFGYAQGRSESSACDVHYLHQQAINHQTPTLSPLHQSPHHTQTSADPDQARASRPPGRAAALTNGRRSGSAHPGQGYPGHCDVTWTGFPGPASGCPGGETPRPEGGFQGGGGGVDPIYFMTDGRSVSRLH